MTTATPQPETRAYGLGELIRAHRLYIGLPQRDMARRLEFDRRDYQRIENGQNACPVGFLSRVEALSDQFAHDVETLLDEADRRGGLALSYPETDEWERLVAGRAAVETAEDAPITLTIVGKLERSA